MAKSIRTVFLLLVLAIGSVQAQQPAQGLKTQKKVLLLMGTRFELVAVSENEELANKAIEAGIKEIQRIEAL
ncbi:MAG: FAD:protein FMN transferase, partial [Hymenobacteraceae bacterium]|nr:FAD:protein FMN transferase [Hymenobacteraceae bacterium]